MIKRHIKDSDLEVERNQYFSNGIARFAYENSFFQPKYWQIENYR